MPLVLISNMIHGVNELTEALTYGEWNERGFSIIRGQLSKLRNTDGGAVFSKDQVTLQGFTGDYEDVENATSVLS